MRQLILTGVVVTALGGYMVTSGLAQGMKIPGESATQSNIVKPAPLDATAERIGAGLLLGAEKMARLHQKRSGLQSSTKLQSSQANSGCMRPELGRVLQ